MEILSGTTVDEWRKEVTCYHCTALLAVFADDIRLGYFGGDYSGDRGTSAYYITCMACGDIVRMTSDDHEKYHIPLLVRKRADAKAGA